MQENSCRVCLTSDFNELVELYTYEDGENYADMIQFCSGIEIPKEEHLPQKICIDCLNKIRSACEIKRKCIETDGLLRMNIKHEPFYSEDFPVKVEVEANPEFVVFSTPVRVQTARSGLKVEPEVDLNELSILEESYSKYLEKQRKEQPGNHDDWSVTPSGSKQSRQPTRPEDYNCVFCEKTFTMIKLKKQHMKADHESELFCRICYRKCKTVFSAEKCIKEHQFGYNNLCQVCGKHFRKKASLELHLAAVHSTKCKMFSCDLCGLQTKHKKSIWRHIRTMHMSKELVGYPCPHLDTCPDLFYMTNNSLRLHLYRHHNVPAPVSCPECNAGFNNISELKNHQKSACVHSSGSGIRRRENLDYSVLCAIIEGRYHCKLCPKSFNLKPQFSHHYQEFHKDNKTCDICNKTFGSAHDYRRHKKVVHDKIKKYRCEHPGCGKTFGYSTGLRNHINTHTGEKPFGCNFCSFRSGDKTTIYKHQKKMHSQEQQLLQHHLGQPT